MNDTEIIKVLQNNGVGVIPTDTVYGVVGRLLSPIAVQRIYEIKRRDPSKRVGTILIADITQIETFVPFKVAEKANQYWPGAVSVVLQLSDKLTYAHKGHNTLAFRIPKLPGLITLLKQTGPLATSSANTEGQPPATTLAQAKAYFGEQPDFYVDGGDLSSHKPSRIIEILADGTEKQIRA